MDVDTTLTPRDHPRTRGVYWHQAWDGVREIGSSPHTRGLLREIGFETIDIWIIPAHAGFTFRFLVIWFTGGDHPRTRGVYGVAEPAVAAMGGSSPHTRGLPRQSGQFAAGIRIIPAHAGFTSQSTLACRPSPDHPRTRGVYAAMRIATLGGRGSSPHTRGLLTGLIWSSGLAGIIPAHAGFTL